MKKIIGWFFLTLGILTIAYSGWSSFEIFTGGKPAPEIFKTQTQTLEEKTLGNTPQDQLSQQLQETVKNQFEKMLPPDFISKSMNLVSWSILAGILIFAGGKISGLGIKLLKS